VIIAVAGGYYVWRWIKDTRSGAHQSGSHRVFIFGQVVLAMLIALFLDRPEVNIFFNQPFASTMNVVRELKHMFSLYASFTAVCFFIAVQRGCKFYQVGKWIYPIWGGISLFMFLSGAYAGPATSDGTIPGSPGHRSAALTIEYGLYILTQLILQILLTRIFWQSYQNSHDLRGRGTFFIALIAQVCALTYVGLGMGSIFPEYPQKLLNISVTSMYFMGGFYALSAVFPFIIRRRIPISDVSRHGKFLLACVRLYPFSRCFSRSRSTIFQSNVVFNLEECSSISAACLSVCH
jgi:hypothetical protein